MSITRMDDGQQTTLLIDGVLDAVTCPGIRPIVEDVVESTPARVTVDLSGLRLIDSSGVAVIVSLYKRIRSTRGLMTVVGVSGQPLAIFRLLRLDRVFRLEAGKPTPRLDPSRDVPRRQAA